MSTLAAEVIIQLNLPIQELDRLLVIFTVAVIQDGRLPDGHPDNRAMLVGTRCPEPVPGLRWSEQNRWNVVDLVGGLSAGAFLRRPATTAPALTSVEDQSEEEDEEEESD